MKPLSYFRLLTFLVLGLLILGCNNEKENQIHLEYCVDHYRAESYKVAKDECQIAAKDYAHAKWLLAHIYHFDLLGDGVKEEQAFKWYLSAAEQGHIPAAREVGNAYLQGIGVAQDFEQAHRWLLKAAQNDDAPAQFLIADLFLDKAWKKVDMGAAIDWLKRAANQGHRMSANNLAWIFATSEKDTFFNKKKALYWLGVLEKKTLDDAIFLDTKAAVLACDNQFERAIEFQNLAISKLPNDTDESTMLAYQKHLEAYQKGRPWRE